ncbi:MAG: YfiH family protein [Halioglobus sp.]|jgi:YfiH family protein
MTFIKPDWPAPAGVVALSTTRESGCSNGAYASFNLAHHVGDDVDRVNRNRDALTRSLPIGSTLQWLQQVHGRNVIEATQTQDVPTADASWTSAKGVGCAVMTADCLPALFCSKNGNKIAAAHAGWRGLNLGILEATVRALSVPPSDLMVWLGPAIGPQAFEVGAEVREQFLRDCITSASVDTSLCFVENALAPGFYWADLYALARVRLETMGITNIYGGDLCTFSNARRFYSYRRDGQTGRMATVILKTNPL